MKIVTKQGYIRYILNQGEKMTYQDPFSEKAACTCGEIASLIMLIDDDEGQLESQRPLRVKVWPHDCTAIALYLCTSCGEMIAKWNQA